MLPKGQPRLDGLRTLASSAKIEDLPPISADLLGSALSRGRTEEARQIFEAAVETANRQISRASNEGETLFALARALESLGKFPEGIASYRSALRVQPDYFSAYSGLAAALASHGKSDEVIAACRKALRRRPGDLTAYYSLVPNF